MDFKNIKEVKADNVIPVFMQLGNECFEIVYNARQATNSWGIFQKLFYNKIFEKNSNYIESLINVKLFKTDSKDGLIVFSDSDKTFRNEEAIDQDTVTKFSKDYYIRNYASSKKNYKNLVVVRKIVTDLELKNFRLFVSTSDDVKESNYKNEYDKVKKIFRRKRKNPYIIKKGNFVIGHINGLILSEEEKLIRYIRSEFSKRVLLGDIVLDDRQEEILHRYMKLQLEIFINYSNKKNFVPDYRRVFAVGLVRYAMKNYSRNHGVDFWPYFKEEFGVYISTNYHEYIHNIFQDIMEKYKKPYFANISNKIDNITMHSFVADNCADKLFNHLLSFWKIDLERGAKDFTEADEDFKDMISSMSDSSNQKVMSHTSLLINDKKTRVELIRKMKRIIKLINDKFWDDKEISDTGNRINRLLNVWFNNPKGEFQQYKNYVRKHEKFEKGEVYYHSPVLNMFSDYNKLRIILPQQRLKDYTKDDYPIWKITCSDPSVIIDDVKPIFKKDFDKDSLGFYIERMTVEIPISSMLYGFSFNLCSGDKEKKYEIKESNIRFFDAKGKNIDYKTANIPTGFVTAYSNSINYPELLDESVSAFNSNGLIVKTMNLVKGQIVILDDGIGLQAGQKSNEGLFEKNPLKGAKVINDNIEYDIYNELPKLLFKASKEELGGISLRINGKDNKVINKSYKEFKLADDLSTNGYLIDLKDYISKDGIYSIMLTYPRNGKQTFVGNIAYCYGLDYKFENAPYIFKNTGKIIFNSVAKIVHNNEETEGIWEIVLNQSSFEFNFDENNKNNDNVCKYVSDGKLNLTCNLNNAHYTICFDIPALYWRLNQSDVWNIAQPANIQLKKLNKEYKKLFVKGPFDFVNSSITTDNDIDLAQEESEIKFVGGKSQFYEINRIYDWFKNNKDKPLRHVYIKLNGDDVLLFDVICRSKLNGVTLIGDFENNIMKGEVDIEGNENYTISIYHDDETIIEDLQIIDNQFEYEFDEEIKTGNYHLYVYEISETDDEDGFDVETEAIPLNSKPIIKQIVNLNNLSNNVIKINGYQDWKKNMLPQTFRNNYFLKDFEAVKYDDFINEENSGIIGIWNEQDIDNEENFIYYKAKLIAENNDKVFELTDVLVAFTDVTKPETIKIFTKDSEGEFDSIKIYDKYRILSEKQYDDLNRDRKKRLRCECFYDNIYYYLIDIEEE